MTLRGQLIEAASQAIWKYMNETVTQSAEAYASVALDAMLDVLTERADEWDKLALDANPTLGIDDIGSRKLLAVLRRGS